MQNCQLLWIICGYSLSTSVTNFQMTLKILIKLKNYMKFKESHFHLTADKYNNKAFSSSKSASDYSQAIVLEKCVQSRSKMLVAAFTICLFYLFSSNQKISLLN